jgi:hypothetical protein
MLLTGIFRNSAADEEPLANYSPASIAVDASSPLLPDRWRIDSYRQSDSLEALVAYRRASLESAGFINLSALSYGFGDGFDDHASFGYRLTAMDRGRLVTFWKSESLAVYLGIRKGGYLSLKIAY